MTLAQLDIPHDADAEHGALAAILVDETAARIGFELLKPDHFYMPRASKAFEYLRGVHAYAGRLDFFSIQSGAKDAGIESGWLLDLATMPGHAPRIEAHARRLDELRILRHAQTAAVKALQLISERAEVGAVIAAMTERPDHAGRGIEPEIQGFRALLDNPPPTPPELVKGLLFKGSKASLSSTSKGYKTWFQLHLGACVATGTPWLGREVERGRVLYVNLELSEWSLCKRIRAIGDAIGVEIPESGFEYAQMRGRRMNLERLVSFAARRIARGGYDLLLIDPLYKLLGGRDENAAGDMAEMLLALESIAHDAGAAMLIAHHYAKGNAGAKFAIDRASGSGVLARDGDAILTLTPHEEADCVTFEAVLRDIAPPAPTTLRWRYPLFELAPDVEVCRHAQPGGRPKKWKPEDAREACKGFMHHNELVEALERKGLSERSAKRCIKEASAQGLLFKVQGVYRAGELAEIRAENSVPK